MRPQVPIIIFMNRWAVELKQNLHPVHFALTEPGRVAPERLGSVGDSN